MPWFGGDPAHPGWPFGANLCQGSSRPSLCDGAVASRQLRYRPPHEWRSNPRRAMFRQRSREALRLKAARGVLYMTVAIGYRRGVNDRLEQDPDRWIREALALVFRQFSEIGSVHPLAQRGGRITLHFIPTYSPPQPNPAVMEPHAPQRHSQSAFCGLSRIQGAGNCLSGPPSAAELAHPMRLSHRQLARRRSRGFSGSEVGGVDRSLSCRDRSRPPITPPALPASAARSASRRSARRSVPHPCAGCRRRTRTTGRAAPSGPCGCG